MTAEPVHPAAKTPDKAPPVAWNPENKQQRRNRTSRRCCCSCCLWITIIIVFVLFLAAVAVTGGILYALYRPHRPTFSVTSLKLSEFNLTDTTLTSTFNLTLTARNPNKKITLVYDEISVKILSGDIGIGEGYFTGFVHGRENVTTLKIKVASSSNSIIDGADIFMLKSIVKNGDLPVKIQLDTKFNKFGKVKAKTLRMRVTCDGINISVPTNKTATFGRISKARCHVDLRFKVIHI
ncbi:NDR1/HIN1-like protein 6 [Primulina huaijiensis]|uniref:NDR1/HIN1-like protein 6 n=1 Tax=Primulina huaijiensis TaxID=1492673 RepID=UPI003CC6E3E5